VRDHLCDRFEGDSPGAAGRAVGLGEE
jgi:hypothetical protein